MLNNLKPENHMNINNNSIVNNLPASILRSLFPLWYIKTKIYLVKFNEVVLEITRYFICDIFKLGNCIFECGGGDF
jgi:hypothetical protein